MIFWRNGNTRDPRDRNAFACHAVFARSIFSAGRRVPVHPKTEFCIPGTRASFPLSAVRQTAIPTIGPIPGTRDERDSKSLGSLFLPATGCKLLPEPD